MIVVEGPDGAGKTTLIERISDDFGLPVVPKAVSESATALTDVCAWVEDHNVDGRRPQIFDRHALISSMVYRPLGLSPTANTLFDEPGWLWAQQRQFWSLRPTVIWCLPPYNTVLDNVADDDESMAAIGHRIDEIYWGYFYISNALAACGNGSHITYDYTKDAYEWVASRLRQGQ